MDPSDGRALGIIANEHCVRSFYRLTQDGLNMDQYSEYSDQMLKALNPNTTFHENVTQVTTFAKGPHSRSELVDEQAMLRLSDSPLLNELDKKI